MKRSGPGMLLVRGFKQVLHRGCLERLFRNLGPFGGSLNAGIMPNWVMISPWDLAWTLDP